MCVCSWYIYIYILEQFYLYIYIYILIHIYMFLEIMGYDIAHGAKLLDFVFYN